MTTQQQLDANVAVVEQPAAQTTSITVTDAAASKVHQLIQEENNPKLKLRVYIMGGGCSGFQYGFSFEERMNEDDFAFIRLVAEGQNPSIERADAKVVETLDVQGGHMVVENDQLPGITFLIDMMSFQYLMGAEIDYQDDVNGARFVIRNPNAKTTCGCGSSFST